MSQERIYSSSIVPPVDSTFAKWKLEIGAVESNEALDLYHQRTLYLPILYFNETLPIYTKLDLALNHYKPFVEYTFYDIGEYYGQSESTKVKYANVLVKTISFILNEKKYDISQFHDEMASHQLKGNSVVINKVYKKNSPSFQDFEDDFSYRDGNEYYNDNLDMDQQSQEFWDSL